MKLPHPFIRLPLRFDARRLEDEVRAVPESAWHRHPSDYEGNSCVRLISMDGGENDDVGGRMKPTAHLLRLPYLQQVLASFGVVWSRSRLMRLGPFASVPEHADINYHWFSRVRVHIPVLSQPTVRFHCGDASVHMAPGEAWIFDNWRRHRVENPTDRERIHLVADTTGSAAFWRAASSAGEPVLIAAAPEGALLLTEQNEGPRVLPPSEIDLLASDLSLELEASTEDAAVYARLKALRVLLSDFCREWRQLWLLHGDGAGGQPAYARLLDLVRKNAEVLSESITMRTNGVPAIRVLEARILRHALRLDPPHAARQSSGGPDRVRIEQPVFIVAAPRSGSTLLFETLACTPQFANFGGEAHWLVEGDQALRPGAAGVGSNRLTAQQCDERVRQGMLKAASARLRNVDGQPWAGPGTARLLEKTPKNVLRIPFLYRAFPDARFIFLWRDPRENISSIIDGWQSGRWITYPELRGWDGPWSFLLPPDWEALQGKSIAAIAAYQWDSANRIALDDLAALPPERWCNVSYAELVARPEEVVRRLAKFCNIAFDGALAGRVSAPLPASRYTLTPPAAGKWLKNATAIEPLLSAAEPTWRRLQELPAKTIAK